MLIFICRAMRRYIDYRDRPSSYYITKQHMFFSSYTKWRTEESEELVEPQTSKVLYWSHGRFTKEVRSQPHRRDLVSCSRTLHQSGSLPTEQLDWWSASWRTTFLTTLLPCSSNHSTGNRACQGLITLLTERGYCCRVDWPSFKICTGPL